MSDPLIADFYAGDGAVDITSLANAGMPWCGIVLKATQGTYYDGGEWLRRHWPAAKSDAGDRYGRDWLRGAYHYLDFAADAAKQADYFLATIEKCGGFSSGDIIAVDVERGGQRVPLTRSLVEDTTSAWVERLGRPVLLYGGELIRSLGITSHMGCAALWTARYAPTLPPQTYQDMGWQLGDLAMWQYAGKTTASYVDSFLAGYPATTPAGLADISAVTMPLETLKQRLCGA